MEGNVGSALPWHKCDPTYWKNVKMCANAVEPSDFPGLIGLKRFRWKSNPELQGRSCSQEANARRPADEMTVGELAAYFEDFFVLPKAMSMMAESMYA